MDSAQKYVFSRNFLVTDYLLDLRGGQWGMYLAERFEYVYRGCVSTLRRTDLGSLDPITHCNKHFPRDGYPFLASVFRRGSLDHSLQNRFGN